MRKQTPVLEWMIAENDAEWERRCLLNCAESEPVANRQRRLPRYFGRVTALLLLLVVAGGWWRRTPQDSAPGAAREAPKTAQVVRRAVAPVGETEMVSFPGDRNVTGLWPQEAQAYISLDAALHTTALKGHGDIILAVVEFGGGRGMAHVVTTAANGAPMHQQKRFYRRTPTGWRQTKVDAAFWGAERSLETPSFVYHFRASDVAAVMAVAPQVDALYTTLHRNFGLLLTPNAEKQVIEVRVKTSVFGWCGEGLKSLLRIDNTGDS